MTRRTQKALESPSPMLLLPRLFLRKIWLRGLNGLYLLIYLFIQLKMNIFARMQEEKRNVSFFLINNNTDVEAMDENGKDGDLDLSP